MKKLLMIIAVALMAVACNKNQKAVKKLDGNWNANSFVISNGVESLDYIALGLEYKMTFNNCKLKDDEFCNVSISIFDGEETDITNGVYRITNEGLSLELKESESSSSSDVFTIDELTKTTLTLTNIEDDLTSTLVLTKE